MNESEWAPAMVTAGAQRLTAGMGGASRCRAAAAKSLGQSKSFPHVIEKPAAGKSALPRSAMVLVP
jgi:hypothetical protein